MAAGRCVGGEGLRDLQPAAVGFLSEKRHITLFDMTSIKAEWDTVRILSVNMLQRNNRTVIGDVGVCTRNFFLLETKFAAVPGQILGHLNAL